MKIRMYLRGLGIGIIVTAILMGITASMSPNMTDEEVIARAESLGMVKEDTVLKPMGEHSEKSEQDEVQPVITEEPEQDEVQSVIAEEPEQDEAQPVITEKSEQDEAKEVITEEPAADDLKDEQKKDSSDENNVIAQAEETEQLQANEAQEEPKEEEKKSTSDFVLEVAGGSGSETVSALLEKGGVVSSAADFDKYLCDHGYDHRIVAGKHVIPAGADYKTIANIITHK